MRRRAAAARQPRPPAPDDVAMPAQDRGRGHDQPHPRQPPGPQCLGENSQPCPVRPGQLGRSPRPFRQATSSWCLSTRISASFHYDSRRDKPSSDTTRDTSAGAAAPRCTRPGWPCPRRPLQRHGTALPLEVHRLRPGRSAGQARTAYRRSPRRIHPSPRQHRVPQGLPEPTT
jgi:hypothetical protein